MEVNGEMDAMLLEDLLSQLPSLQRRLLSEHPEDALQATRRLAGLWADGLPLRAFSDLPQHLVQLAGDAARPREPRLAALQALCHVAPDTDLLHESRALPLCVGLLQSADEGLRDQAFQVLERVRQQGDVF